MLTTPLSVIAGLVVGEFAVQSGWFNAETMLYMAFVAIANYTQASYELGYALKFMRILLADPDGGFRTCRICGRSGDHVLKSASEPYSIRRKLSLSADPI